MGTYRKYSDIYKKLSLLRINEVEKNKNFIEENRQLAWDLREEMVSNFLIIPTNDGREALIKDYLFSSFSHLKKDFQYAMELLGRSSESDAYKNLGTILYACNAEIYCTFKEQSEHFGFEVKY